MLKVQIEDAADAGCFLRIYDETSAARIDIVSEHRVTADPLAFLPCGRLLIAGAFGIISRSNWAKERRMFSVSRPIEFVVLNCCVTETKLTPRLSNNS